MSLLYDKMYSFGDARFRLHETKLFCIISISSILLEEYSPVQQICEVQLYLIVGQICGLDFSIDAIHLVLVLYQHVSNKEF